jgi:drug/metabolite transporter (DMT)-like permease
MVAKLCPPLLLIALRMGIAGSILSLYLLITRRSSITVNKNHIFLYLQLILCAGIIPYFLRYWAFAQSTSSNLSFWLLLTPFVGYVMAGWLGVNTMTYSKSVALLLGFAGILISGSLPVSATAISCADFALIASIILFTYGWLLIQKMVTQLNYSILAINAFVMLASGISAGILSFFLEQHLPVANVKALVLPLLCIIVISNLFAHNLYAYLLTRYSLTLLQLGTWVSPLLYSILVLRQVSVGSLFGLLLVVLASIFFYCSENVKVPLYNK